MSYIQCLGLEFTVKRKKELIFLDSYALESEFSLLVSSSEFLSLFEIASGFSMGYTLFYSLIWLVVQEGIKTACNLRGILIPRPNIMRMGFKEELLGHPSQRGSFGWALSL